MQVGVSPLVAMVGAVQWTSQSDARAGTLLLRDGKLAARVFSPTASSLEVFDPEGVALLRATGPKMTVVRAVLESEALPAEVRALTACQLLNTSPRKAAP